MKWRSIGSKGGQCNVCGRYVYFGATREKKCQFCGTLNVNPNFTKLGTRQAETQLAFVEQKRKNLQKYGKLKRKIVEIIQRNGIASVSDIYYELGDVQKKQIYRCLQYLVKKKVIKKGYVIIKNMPESF